MMHQGKHLTLVGLEYTHSDPTTWRSKSHPFVKAVIYTSERYPEDGYKAIVEIGKSYAKNGYKFKTLESAQSWVYEQVEEYLLKFIQK